MSEATSNQFRAQIASVEQVLSALNTAPLIEQHGRLRVKAAIQALQTEARAQAQPAEAPGSWLSEPESYAAVLMRSLQHRGYQAVYNMSGTLIHTNLGRAPLSPGAWKAVEPLVTGNLNLEYDLKTGRRGQREGTVVERICALTGAEAATIVNNTAAALVLVLNTFALGRPVPVSRGELIEIGGSFRLPDIMKQAGARLREVGTTNRTHLEDYETAIDAETAMLLKVHPSNYAVEGFTSTVDLKSLAALAQSRNIPLCEDLGSGALLDLTRYGLPPEPLPGQSLRAGADLVLFSGDKLLGGPQAGFIVGRRSLIDDLNRNPLKRALRLDKIALTLLDYLLARYEDPNWVTNAVPILGLFSKSTAMLAADGTALLSAVTRWASDCEVSVEPSECQVGSGALPTSRLESRAICLRSDRPAVLKDRLRALRALPRPVIGRLQQDALWLDLRGAEPLEALIAQFEAAATA